MLQIWGRQSVFGETRGMQALERSGAGISCSHFLIVATLGNTLLEKENKTDPL